MDTYRVQLIEVFPDNLPCSRMPVDETTEYCTGCPGNDFKVALMNYLQKREEGKGCMLVLVKNGVKHLIYANDPVLAVKKFATLLGKATEDDGPEDIRNHIRVMW